MCLAIPGRITEIEDGYAVVDYGGVSKRASLRLYESAKVGQYALVHAGFVIQILQEDEGEELSRLVGETVGLTDDIQY